MMLAATTSMLAILSTACSSDDDPEPTATAAAAPTSTATATERAPVSPPSEGVPITENGYTVEDAFPQLDYERMIEIDAVPGDDDAAVVVTQAGIVYRFSLTNTSIEPTVFLDISDRIISNAGNEEGLLGLAFAPDYEQSGWFYLNYSAGPPRQNTAALPRSVKQSCGR